MAKNTFGYVITVLLVGAGGYLTYRYFKGKQQNSVIDSAAPAGTKTTNGAPVSTLPAPSAFPLKLGSKGDAVKTLQTILGVQNLPQYGIDGDFGLETLAALQHVFGVSQIDSVDQLRQLMGSKGLISDQYAPKPITTADNYNYGIPGL